MENNQQLVPAPQENRAVDTNPKDEKGRFKKGFSGNKTGGFQSRKGLQAYDIRCAYWLKKLKAGELIELWGDKTKLAKLNLYDAIIIGNIAGSLLGQNMGTERERLLNRIFGRPKQIVEQLTGPVAPQLSKDYTDTRSAEMSYAAQMQAAMASAPVPPSASDYSGADSEDQAEDDSNDGVVIE